MDTTAMDGQLATGAMDGLVAGEAAALLGSAFAPTEISEKEADEVAPADDEVNEEQDENEGIPQSTFLAELAKNKTKWGCVVIRSSPKRVIVLGKVPGPESAGHPDAFTYTFGDGTAGEDIVLAGPGITSVHFTLSPIKPSSPHHRLAIGCRVQKGHHDAQIQVDSRPGAHRRVVIEGRVWDMYGAFTCTIGPEGNQIVIEFYPSGRNFISDTWVGERIGKGGEGVVFMGRIKSIEGDSSRDPSSSGSVAIKLILKKGRGKKEAIAAEKIIAAGGHRNILVPFKNNVFAPGQVAKVMMTIYQDGRGLDTKLGDPDLRLPSVVMKYLTSVVDALVWLRIFLKLLHMDHKPSNTLVSSDDLTQATFRLADFGLAMTYEPGKMIKGVHGTPGFTAPEVIDATSIYSPEKAEVFMVGETAVQLVGHERISTRHGTTIVELPARFRGKDVSRAETVAKSLRRTGDHAKDHAFREGLCDLLKGMLHSDPNERITLEQVADHYCLSRESNILAVDEHGTGDAENQDNVNVAMVDDRAEEEEVVALLGPERGTESMDPDDEDDRQDTTTPIRASFPTTKVDGAEDLTTSPFTHLKKRHVVPAESRTGRRKEAHPRKIRRLD